MADLLLPPNLTVARASFKYLDSTGVSRGKYSGLVRTASLGGDRLGATLSIAPQGGATPGGKLARAQLVDFMASLRGRQNRALFWDRGYTPRGSMPMTEIVSNGDFSGGTTGWTPVAGQAAVSVNDLALRVKRIGNNASANGYAAASISLASYTPYVWRFAVGGIVGGQVPYATVSTGFGQIAAGAGYYGALLTDAGVTTCAAVSYSAGGNTVYLDNHAGAGALVGGYYDVLWASCAQCLMADAPDNYFINNDAPAGSSWARTNCNASSGEIGPTGNADAFALIPTTTALVAHYIAQTNNMPANSVVVLSGNFKVNGYSYVRLQITEGGSGTVVYRVFNITTGAGALGTTAFNSANWTEPRAFIVDLGNGWYNCTLIARNTNGATSYSGNAVVENSDSVAAWTANGTSGIRFHQLTMSISGLPGQTVLNSSGTSATGQSAGGAGASQIYVRSAQASASGLLLPGDQCEIQTSFGSELKIVTSSLDTDAAGRGTLCFLPPLRGTVLGNYPIVVNRPLGRFVYAGQGLEWATDPGIFTGASFDFEEAPL